jgi:DNA end-binding protein Ku
MAKRAPRAIWTGTISFGMVSIPVRLYTATESHDVHFHLLHKKDGVRLKNVRWCPKDEKAVPWEEVVRGFEYAKGKYVPMTEEDLEHLPKTSPPMVPRCRQKNCRWQFP